MTPFGPILAVSNVVLATLWLWLTIAGWRAGRQRRFAAHRRHMLRSGVLALSTITNRIWTPILFIALEPLRDGVFGGDDERYLWLVAGLGAWLGWTVPMLALQWWLSRRPEPPTVMDADRGMRRSPRRASAGPAPCRPAGP